MGQHIGSLSLFERPTEPDFQAMAEGIPHIVWVATPDGSTQYFNRQGTDYTGCPPEANYGWDWVNLVHPNDAERARAAWECATRTVTPYNLEYRIRRADGEYRWHAFRSVPFRGPEGRVIGWIGTATDIEEAKRTQLGLLESERRLAETARIFDVLQSSAPVGFGFVDLDFRLVRINERLAAVNGGSVTEQVGRKVSDVVPALWPTLEPLYRRVLDDGTAIADLEMSGETAEDPGRRHHWLTSYYPVRLDGQTIGIGIVVVDITDRKEAEEARQQIGRASVDAMAATVEARDPYTAGHQRRVAQIAAAIACEMDLSPCDTEGIELTANIHDIGKIRIPAEILARPGKLQPSEFELVKSHSVAGYDIVKGIKFPWPVATMVRQHHERFDGSGYPDRLRGDEIILGARIIAVADVLEAFASHRPYRPSRGFEAAFEEIRRGRGSLFDPDVVDALIRAAHHGRLPFHRLDDVTSPPPRGD